MTRLSTTTTVIHHRNRRMTTRRKEEQQQRRRQRRSSFFSSLILKTTMLFFGSSLLLLLVVVVVVHADVIRQPIQLHGLNYNIRRGPDWASDEERCKDEALVRTELQLLSQMTTRIRLLSLVDCNQGPLVVEMATDLALTVWLGLWVSSDSTVLDNEIVLLQDMITNGQLSASSSVVEGIAIGSEAIRRGDVGVDDMIAHQQRVVQVLVDAGIPDGTIPVGVADSIGVYDINPSLRAATDVVVANIFPFWQQNVTPEQAVDILLTTLDLQPPTKPVLIGETGWSASGTNGAASIASAANQARYFQDFYCRIHVDRPSQSYFWFTGIDNTWIQQQAQALAVERNVLDLVEGNFGLVYSTNLTLKTHLRDLSFSCAGHEFDEEGNTIVYEFDIDDGTTSTTIITATPTQNPTTAPSKSPTKSPVVGPTPAPQLIPTPSPTTPLPTPIPTVGTTTHPTQTASPTSKPRFIPPGSTIPPGMNIPGFPPGTPIPPGTTFPPNYTFQPAQLIPPAASEFLPPSFWTQDFANRPSRVPSVTWPPAGGAPAAVGTNMIIMMMGVVLTTTTMMLLML